MKKQILSSVLMVLVFTSGLLISCSKEDVTPDTVEAPLLLKSAPIPSCSDCMTNWTDSKVTLKGWVKKNTTAPVLSQLSLEAWNDLTQIHFKIKATSVTFTWVRIGAVQVFNVAGSTEYAWNVNLADAFPSGWEKCNTLTTAAISIGGISGGIGTTDAPTFTYNMRAVSTTTTIATAPDFVCKGTPVKITGTVTAGETITGGTIDILEGTTVVASALASAGSVEFTYTAEADKHRTFKAVYKKVSGYCASESASSTVVVNPDATIKLSSAEETQTQTACVNEAINAITYTIGGGGTGAGVVGLPEGVTGSFVAGVFTISGTPTETGTFNYTVTTTGTCEQKTATGSLTVNDCSMINPNGEADGCTENFSYIDNGDGTYTFTYTPDENMDNKLVTFTFAQSDRVTITGLGDWNANGATRQKNISFIKCEPVSWTVGLTPTCSGHTKKSNVWTDFTIDGVSKKNTDTPTIEITCP